LTARDGYSQLKERFELARTLAISHSQTGEVIGRVSRVSPVEVDEDQFIVNVVVDHHTYYKYPFIGRLGVLLAVVDIRTLNVVLMRAVGYQRKDANVVAVTSKEVAEVLEGDSEEPGGLLTNVTVLCKPLTRIDVMDHNEVEVGDLVVEPQSPVVLPKSWLVEVGLSLNRGPLKLGILHESYSAGQEVPVSLDPSDLNYHVLVLGTTGAGKTSFIKDLLASAQLSDPNGRTFVLDATGDYYNTFLPPSDSSPFTRWVGKIDGLDLTVVYPVTKNWLRRFAKGNTISMITSTYYDLYVKSLVNYLQSKGLEIRVVLDENRIILTSPDWKAQVRVLPFFFKFPLVKSVLPRLNPYFSEQATHFLRIALRELKPSTLNQFIDGLEGSGLMDRLQVHRSTRENIMRGLHSLRETGLFDLPAQRIPLSKAEGKLVVLDLYNLEADDFSQKVLAYYFLDTLFSAREREVREGKVSGRYVIVIDEAHRFFPSSRGGDNDVYYVSHVAGKVSQMMRLGRRRKIGFIFSTHAPEDLNETVVELSNTKVLFRMDRNTAESMGLSRQEAWELSLEQNGVAYLLSPWLREGRVKLRVSVPPPLGHYDLSRT
jgi:Predicted ATPase